MNSSRIQPNSVGNHGCRRPYFTRVKSHTGKALEKRRKERRISAIAEGSMATLCLLNGDDASSSVQVSIPLALGTSELGREKLRIHDNRVSRRQLAVTISDKGTAVTRLGANASFIKYPGDAQAKELSAHESVNVPPGSIIYLVQAHANRSFQYPVRITRTCSASDVVWKVMLGNSFKPYDRPIQDALEAAFQAGATMAKVNIRGMDYSVSLWEPRRQAQVGDPSKTRVVRREIESTPSVLAAIPQIGLLLTGCRRPRRVRMPLGGESADKGVSRAENLCRGCARGGCVRGGCIRAERA